MVQMNPAAFRLEFEGPKKAVFHRYIQLKREQVSVKL